MHKRNLAETAPHRRLVPAMVQYVYLAALAGEVAKHIAPPVSEVLSVDEVAAQLISRHRAHLTAMLAKAPAVELVSQQRLEWRRHTSLLHGLISWPSEKNCTSCARHKRPMSPQSKAGMDAPLPLICACSCSLRPPEPPALHTQALVLLLCAKYRSLGLDLERRLGESSWTLANAEIRRHTAPEGS